MACLHLSVHQFVLTCNKTPWKMNSTPNTISRLKGKKATLMRSITTLVWLQRLGLCLTCPNLRCSTRLYLINNPISTILRRMLKQDKKNENNDELKRIDGQSGILAFGVAVRLWKSCWKFTGRLRL